MVRKSDARRKSGAGAVELTEQDLEQVKGASMLASDAPQSASITVRGWDPSKKKAIVDSAD